MNKNYCHGFNGLLALCLLLGGIRLSAQAEELLDAVVAVVDGEPITISDLESQIGLDLDHDLKKLSSDQATLDALQELIETRVLENEARERKVTIDQNEVDAYISEVAQRNNLTMAGFEQALNKEGSSLAAFRRRTKSEILRSKLASALLNREIAISNEEVDARLKQNSDLMQLGEQIELAQIFISLQSNTSAAAAEKLIQIKQALQQKSAPFAELARQFSDAPEGAEGGILPLVKPEELSLEIRQELNKMSVGSVSNPVLSEDGYRLFQLIKRHSVKQQRVQIRKEIREKLRKEKIATTLQSFFMSDIYKKHTIDKKI